MNGMIMAAYTELITTSNMLKIGSTYKINDMIYTHIDIPPTNIGVSGDIAYFEFNKTGNSTKNTPATIITVDFSDESHPIVYAKPTAGGRRRKSKKTRRPKRKHNKSRKH